MSSAIELSGYVQTKNRRALEELRAHRRKMLVDLQSITGISPAKSVEAVQDEIAAIEAGLQELKPPPGTVPENEWQ
ncbi:hypothetical protein [Bradyrhizobium sp. MOS002]|uniref:hypothetical protein n=1 Tax=Bradyrhizobium sp. MOS002 TaxID=2133947 RepID=UPI000D131878|nr:hypothetical protein [Bradyrhizobium sp. MOS002]PSO24158.1 hypothetical protein C7G41_31350 [Bradyrhizobium sp. MOS002]